MGPFRNRTFVRLAAVAALAAGLALAGCGRKGPLEPPPSAAIAAAPENRASLGEIDDPNMTGFRRPPPPPVAQPVTQAVPPERRTFILDPLIR